MEKAFIGNYDLFVIQFATQTIKQREALTELCAVLKRHHPTRHIPIIALLPSKHRRLLEILNTITVEYAKITNGQTDETSIRAITPADCISRILAELCPFLEYQPIDARREMAVCKAYYSRLVINGMRLDQLCQRPDFQLCPYFQSPKLKNNQ